MSSICDQPGQAEHCAEMLKALAHPLRLKIVAILCEGEEHVSGLSKRLNVNQPTVSQHLRILRMRNLVGFTRKQGFAMYWLAEERLTDMISCVERCGTRTNREEVHYGR